MSQRHRYEPFWARERNPAEIRRLCPINVRLIGFCNGLRQPNINRDAMEYVVIQEHSHRRRVVNICYLTIGPGGLNYAQYFEIEKVHAYAPSYSERPKGHKVVRRLPHYSRYMFEPFGHEWIIYYLRERTDSYLPVLYSNAMLQPDIANVTFDPRFHFQRPGSVSSADAGPVLPTTLHGSHESSAGQRVVEHLCIVVQKEYERRLRRGKADRSLSTSHLRRLLRTAMRRFQRTEPILERLQRIAQGVADAG